jgi:four helix bundle protein
MNRIAKELIMALLNYTELDTWQKAMELVEDIYHATKEFPREEMYGLTAQLRRAAISIPSNIAEGQGRKSPKEFVHHLRIAHGSLRELETQLLIAQRLNYLEVSSAELLLSLAGEVGRLINGLIRSLCRD